jgi:hypothetical protein
METFNRVNNSNSSLTRIIPFILIFIGILGLYYLYQYLFGPNTNNSYSLITSTRSAQTDKPLTFSATQLAPLYEGGDFSVSTWIYITNWSYRAGFNKPILRIGGTNFDTIRVYLGAHTPKLYVRLHTKEQGAITTASAPLMSAPLGTVPPGTTTYSASSAVRPNSSATTSAMVTTGPSPDSLEPATYNMTFNTMQTESGLLDHSHICDIPELAMQRWVNISLSVNGKTVDVYIDGKLSRSCVLPNPFKVDNGYTGFVLENGGFAGKISTTTMYDTALSPEAVYTNYMAGPEPITSITGLLGSIFAPNLNISITNTSQ